MGDVLDTLDLGMAKNGWELQLIQFTCKIPAHAGLRLLTLESEFCSRLKNCDLVSLLKIKKHDCLAI